MVKSYDPTDTERQGLEEDAAREQAKMRTRIERDDLVWLMRSKQGRRIAYRWLEAAGIWRLSFSTNALQMAFNEGNRNNGLAMVAKLGEFCEDSYALMLKEHKEDD